MSLTTILTNHYNNNALSHAYLIEGGGEIEGELFSFLEDIAQIPIRGNPDLAYKKTETFKIEDARELKTRASIKAKEQNSKKIFIVNFNFITTEAQNSLLKLFEEPTPNTHFFIITLNSSVLLPTLYSRLTTISNTLKKEAQEESVEGFLSANLPRRLEIVSKIVKDKDKPRAISFINELESKIYHATDSAEYDKNTIRALRELQKNREYLYSRAPSIKMILEHTAFVTPQR